ncbi:hypothetical protein ACIQOW_10620 [Kitasatospora sp. NPDC091335]|uniref:hypothetical protein n=1 Tax=Kitasatospora sp. NPDC091335 TaxID=3364085 RepID=UPI003819C915
MEQELIRSAAPPSAPFPVLPAIGVLHPVAEPFLRQRVLTAVDCLQRIVRAYPGSPALQDFLDVPPVLHRWIVRHPRPESLTVDFCRLDLFGDRLGTVRVLEFNASSPGGVIGAGIVARLWRRTPGIGALLDQWRAPGGRFEDENWFAERATLRTIVPWSRKLGDGITVEQAAAGRTRLVLKAPYGYVGNSVRIGCEHGPEEWAELVGSPQHQGWLVQERVAPAAVGALTRDLCVAVLDRTVLGYFSRAGRSSLVNLARGGGVQTVLSSFPAA